MSTLRHLRRVLLAALPLAIPALLLMTPAAFAAATATTGPATSVTMTTAILQGVLDPTDANSAWAFQYGAGTTYTTVTQVNPVTPGLRAVSQQIVFLKPGTTYHYRILVVQGSYPRRVDAGGDMSFTTPTSNPGPAAPSYGTATLRSTKLTVAHGKLAIPFACSGPAKTACNGAVKLTVKTGRTTLTCLNGAFIALAGHRHSVRARLNPKCRALLDHARGHRLKAAVKATFTTHQTPLRNAVTLAGT